MLHAETKVPYGGCQGVCKKSRFRGWKTTDEEEVERRQLRASTEPMSIKSLEPRHRLFGTFTVHSAESPRGYVVEIRSLTAIRSRIVDAGFLPADAVATMATVREVSQSQGLRLRAVQALMVSAHQFIKDAEELIDQKSLRNLRPGAWRA